MADNNVTNEGMDTTEVSTGYEGYEEYPAEKPSKKFAIGATITAVSALAIGATIVVKKVLNRKKKTQEALDEVFDESEEPAKQPLEISEEKTETEVVDKPKPARSGAKK